MQEPGLAWPRTHPRSRCVTAAAPELRIKQRRPRSAGALPRSARCAPTARPAPAPAICRRSPVPCSAPPTRCPD